MISKYTVFPRRHLAVGDWKNDFNVEHEFRPFKFELKLWKMKCKAL